MAPQHLAEQRSARSTRRVPLRSAVAWATIASGAATVVIALTGLLGLWTTGGDDKAPTACARTGLRSSLERGVDVSAVGPGVDRHLVFSQVVYGLRRLANGQPALTIAGRVSGDLTADEVLYLVARPRPDSSDQLGKPGNGRFYPALRIVPDADGCWLAPERSIGYPEVWGVEYTYSILVIDQQTADEFDAYKREHESQPELPNDGWAPDEFDEFATELIATFPVRTRS